MKRLLVLLLILPCILCSCNVVEVPREETTTPTAPANPEVPTDPTIQGPVYTTPDSVPRYTTDKFQRGYFGFAESNLLLSCIFPQEWKMQKSIDGLEIMRNGNKVGKLVLGDATDVGDWKALTLFERNLGNGQILKFVEQQKSSELPTFRYRFVYTYRKGTESRKITLTADCAEIGTQTERKLMSGGFMNKSENPVCGTLMHIDSPRSILILGNSFISSSNIGSILQEMLTRNGKSCSVHAVSRGGAVVGSYAQDTSMMNTIRQGNYDLVLMCGFYGNDQTVKDFATVRAACEASDTELVIFPAHNENESVIKLACEGTPPLVCIHWKNELDLLIEGGVNRWDLCTDDTYDHSKPLAGYVGAHMVYRALYGEAPAKALQTSISQFSVDRVLGGYSKSTDLRVCEESEIIYLS